MRIYIDIPAPLLEKLRDQAQAAHRPPRYQIEWLIMQALQGGVPWADAAFTPQRRTREATHARD